MYYFQVRYYGSTLARFLSIDPGNTGAVAGDPQSWNAYAYALNNPLFFVDPTGLASESAGPTQNTGPIQNCELDSANKCEPPKAGRQDQTARCISEGPCQSAVIGELSRLANQYGVPPELVQAVAYTESGYDTTATNINHNEAGKPVSTDYGLMQINQSNFGRPVSGPDGSKFLIPSAAALPGQWKANANAGVALLAEEYKYAAKEHPNASSRQLAQESYSGYNAGRRSRHRYQSTLRNGQPAHRNDRNFLRNYLRELKK